jgi:hypothetical protein
MLLELNVALLSTSRVFIYVQGFHARHRQVISLNSYLEVSTVTMQSTIRLSWCRMTGRLVALFIESYFVKNALNAKTISYFSIHIYIVNEYFFC